MASSRHQDGAPAAMVAPAPLVVPLSAALALGPDEVGRKALNLARLAGAGLPVPPAFVVTAAAWRRALEAAGLAEQVEGLAAARDAAAAGGRLHAACLALPLPDDVVAALAGALADLPVGPLAVRSSALDEDERELSAAGLFATTLDVRGLPAALDALRASWASLFSRAALAYRRDRGLPLAPRPMAVVVQRCLTPTAAGVLFTRAGAPDELLVEAVPGAGRALVDGLADPARWVLDAAGGVREAPARGGDLLDAPTLEALARAAVEVERALGAEGDGGLDLEWAVEGGRLWVVQARPVTREAPAGARGRVRWTAANTQEALLDPVTPLTWSLFAPLVEAGRRDLFRLGGLPELEGPGYMRLFYGLPYFNPDYFRAFLRLIPGAPEGIFDALIFGERAGTIAFDLPAFDRRTARLGLLFVAARLLARERFELFLRVFALRLAWLARRDLPLLADRDLLRLRRDATGLLEEALRRHVLGTAISGAAYLLLELFLRRTGAEAEFEGKLVAHLTAGAPGNALAVASGHLERLAERAAARPALAAALCAQAPRTLEELEALGDDGRWLRGELARFLADFGHRCEKEAELAEPRWADDPSVILAVLGSLVRAARDQGGGMPRLADREERLARRAGALARRVSRHLVGQGALERALPLRRGAFRALLREARRYAPYRENLKDSALRALHLVRRVFLEVGRRLAVRGLVERPDDVFFLEVEEAEAALAGGGADLRARVAARRAERAANQAQEPPRYVIEVPGAPPRPVHVPSRVGHLVEGVGVSGGRVTARARVLRGMEDAGLVQPGDVIVARVVNAGWTPLFHLAGGIVAEVGGVLSHAAIVAREYGIPAVFGAAGATRIADGARVTVDGDLGIVTVE
ncbi:MAG: PEP-utilizing enzyme [Planctomycetes bacterium]|nr:PEP-utilizing enzyme [Planctomycetota bacterium]